MNAEQWARAYRAMADELDRIDAEERAEKRDWIAQAKSPLGNRRHGAAVRRRVAAGEDGAAILGRRLLLSPTSLEAELQALAAKPKKPTTENDTVAGRLERKLGLVRSA